MITVNLQEVKLTLDSLLSEISEMNTSLQLIAESLNIKDELEDGCAIHVKSNVDRLLNSFHEMEIKLVQFEASLGSINDRELKFTADQLKAYRDVITNLSDFSQKFAFFQKEVQACLTLIKSAVKNIEVVKKGFWVSLKTILIQSGLPAAIAAGLVAAIYALIDKLGGK